MRIRVVNMYSSVNSGLDLIRWGGIVWLVFTVFKGAKRRLVKPGLKGNLSISQ